MKTYLPSIIAAIAIAAVISLGYLHVLPISAVGQVVLVLLGVIVGHSSTVILQSFRKRVR